MRHSHSFRSCIFLIASFVAFSTASADRIDFPELVKIAERYDLPNPPANAKLVLAATGERSVSHSTKVPEPGEYSPAFLLETLPDSRARILMGWQELTVTSEGEFHPATHEYSLSEDDSDRKEYCLSIGSPSGFMTVVQLAHRGDMELARELWGEFQGHDSFWFFGIEGDKPLIERPRDLLVQCIYHHLYTAYLQGTTDPGTIHRKLSRLRKEFPFLFSRNSDDSHQYRRLRFLCDLRTTLRARPAAEGSVEWLLMKWANEVNRAYFLDLYDTKNSADDPARQIVAIGTAAIPDLLRLSSDQRLTRISSGGLHIPVDIPRVGELARELLDLVCGSQDPRLVALLLRKPPPDREFFELAAITVVDGKITQFHEAPLWILAQRYPRSVLALCKRATKEAPSECSLYDISESIVHAGLTHDEKTKALVDVCEAYKDYFRKREILENLAQLNQIRCIALLHPVLGAFPTDLDYRYVDSEASRYSNVLIQLEDDQIWTEYLRAVKRAAVGLRMQMMEPMSHSCCCGDKNKARRLAFLAAFLEDTAVRNRAEDEDKFICGAAFMFEKIEVRNHAAMGIAALLDLDDYPDKSWTDDQWSDFREKVRAALKKESLPILSD